MGYVEVSHMSCVPNVNLIHTVDSFEFLNTCTQFAPAVRSGYTYATFFYITRNSVWGATRHFM